MKVGQLYEAAQIDATSRVGTRPAGLPVGGATSTAAPPVGPETDTVELSITSLPPGPAANSGIDEAKVNAIRKALSEGKYQIDIAKIADSMIAQAAELVEAISRGPENPAIDASPAGNAGGPPDSPGPSGPSIPTSGATGA